MKRTTITGRGVSGAAKKLAKAKPAAIARISFTLSPSLAVDIQESADAESGGNVSAWLAEAAQRRVRARARREFVRQYEAEHGKITDEEMEEARKRWASQ